MKRSEADEVSDAAYAAAWDAALVAQEMVEWAMRAERAAEEAQAAWNAWISWVTYVVVRAKVDEMRKAQDAEVRVSARAEAEAAYAVAQREEKAAWAKVERTWAAWNAAVRKTNNH